MKRQTVRRLRIILEDFELEPPPVHVIHPDARLSAAKTRAFVDFVTPLLKKELARVGVQTAAATAGHRGRATPVARC